MLINCTYGTPKPPGGICPSGRGHLAGRARRRRPHPVASAAAAALADNTRAAYAAQWNRFRAWCERRGGVDPLDAGAPQVAAYLAERAETRKLSTVQASAAAIRGSWEPTHG